MGASCCTGIYILSPASTNSKIYGATCSGSAARSVSTSPLFPRLSRPQLMPLPFRIRMHRVPATHPHECGLATVADKAVIVRSPNRQRISFRDKDPAKIFYTACNTSCYTQIKEGLHYSNTHSPPLDGPLEQSSWLTPRITRSKLRDWSNTHSPSVGGPLEQSSWSTPCVTRSELGDWSNTHSPPVDGLLSRARGRRQASHVLSSGTGRILTVRLWMGPSSKAHGRRLPLHAFCLWPVFVFFFDLATRLILSLLASSGATTVRCT